MAQGTFSTVPSTLMTLLIPVKQWAIIVSEPYNLAVMGYKTLLLLMYLRLFGVNLEFKYACWATMFLTCAYITCSLVTTVVGCVPIEKYWKPDLPGHCIHKNAANIAYGAMFVITDLLIAILPLPMVWNLQLTLRKRINVSVVFLGGAIAFAVTIVRFSYGILYANRPNEIERSNRLLFWSVLKVNIGLICGCLPTLKPILDLVRGCPKKIAYKRRELRELELTDDRHRLSVLPEEEEEEEERRERTKERERKTSSVDSIDLLYGSEEARGNRHGAWA